MEYKYVSANRNLGIYGNTDTYFPTNGSIYTIICNEKQKNFKV